MKKLIFFIITLMVCLELPACGSLQAEEILQIEETEKIEEAEKAEKTEEEEAIVDSGNCGEEVVWKLDINGTLFISGTGAIWGSSEWDKKWEDELVEEVVIEGNITNLKSDIFSFTPWYQNQGDFVIVSGILLDYRGLEKDVIIPDEVISIGDNAFSYCEGLTSISIPEGVTSIGDGAFSFCDDLMNIIVKEGNVNYSSEDGIVFNKNKTELFCYPCGKNDTYIIPKSVISIRNRAFSGCRGLTSISIPESVTSIGNEAFFGCSGLTSISIPESVTSIGDGAFSGCSGLRSISIPENVTNIEDGTFFGCSGLRSISIPESVTSIGDSAFSECRGLRSISIPESVTSIGYSVFFNCRDLEDIYYGGSQADWNIINEEDWTGVTIHYGSD